MVRKIKGGCLFVLAIAGASLACGAGAQELDELLPVPGYGTPFAVSAPRPPRPEAAGLRFGDATLAPALALGAGYDSAPDGAAGSPLLSAQPSLLITDPLIGFSAYAAANATRYPADTAQDNQGTAIGLGEAADLPMQKIVLAAGYITAEETGFAIDTTAITTPIAYSLRNVRVSDEVIDGDLTVTPAFAATWTRIPALAAENREDTREDLTVGLQPGGPVRYLVRLHATQSVYRAPPLNAATTGILAGFSDSETGLWTLSALGGLARRGGVQSRAITAPVLEAALDWRPAALDPVRLTLVREIDDPDQIEAAPYTLTQARLTAQAPVFTDTTLSFTGSIAHAAFLGSALQETLAGVACGAVWQAGPAWALTGTYGFNDRQANALRAANEQVFTLGLAWTP